MLFDSLLLKPSLHASLVRLVRKNRLSRHTFHPRIRTWGFDAGPFAARLVDGSALRVSGVRKTVEGAARRNPWNLAADGGEEVAELRRSCGGECSCCWRAMGGG